MLINADCFEALRDMPSNSVEAVVTDPPYGLGACTPTQVAECLQAWSSGKTWKPKGSGFMGKAWDAWVPPPELWREVLRVLKPGGHALVFAGSRTQDLMGMSLRLAGFEMRDVIQWLYGSGFPKSHDVSKALDKMAGAEREVIGHRKSRGGRSGGTSSVGDHLIKYGQHSPITEPASELAQQWEGWGTALKPAYEPALLVRKPLSGTVAQNTLDHGCGAINIDASRISTSDSLGGGELKGPTDMSQTCGGPEWDRPWRNDPSKREHYARVCREKVEKAERLGRWPSNIILDEQSSEQLEQQAGTSRFFYTAKASKSEREAGLSHYEKFSDGLNKRSLRGAGGGLSGSVSKRANVHPTVKPIDLMRYLIRLITPPHGTVLDPFMGSGSTGCAAALEGVDFIGIEREPEYFAIAQQRVAYWSGDVEAFEYPEPAPEELEQPSLFEF